MFRQWGEFMKSPIERIEELENRLAELHIFLPMLQAAHEDFEARRKAHDLTKLGNDPSLHPVAVPPVDSIGE